MFTFFLLVVNIMPSSMMVPSSTMVLVCRHRALELFSILVDNIFGIAFDISSVEISIFKLAEEETNFTSFPITIAYLLWL